jgi:hypothetical protein
MLKMERSDYEAIYLGEILAALDPKTVWDELHALVEPHEPVLLCWERLQRANEWCHRRMVADWFHRSLGVSVKEES